MLSSSEVLGSAAPVALGQGGFGWGQCGGPSPMWRGGRARPLLVLGAGFLENGLNLGPVSPSVSEGGCVRPLCPQGWGPEGALGCVALL